MCIRDSAVLEQELTAAMNRLQLRDPSFSTLLYNRYFGINTDPVSYTHLDVYKRQIRGIARALRTTGTQACGIA